MNFMPKPKSVCPSIQDASVQDITPNDLGLSEEQADRNRQLYGSNAIGSGGHISFGKCLNRAFVNPFSTILFVLAVISFVTEVLSHNTGNLRTVVIILVMLVISGGIRLVQELRSKQIADGLTRLVHMTVSVLRSGKWQEMSSEDIVVGDVVQLEAGDRVPADIRLTQAEGLFVSQSVITGETAVLEKTAAALPQIPAGISDYHNTVFMGTTVTGGKGRGVVLAVGKDTVYGNFEAPERKKGFDRGANAIAWVLIRFMAVLVPVVFLANGLTHGDWLSAFLFALSVAVGLAPEMLPMVISACLAKGSSGMRKKQTIVKDINAMQGFGSMDILCVDKTGTLTGDTLLLEYYMDILGNECQTVLDYGYLGSSYHTGVQNHLDAAIQMAGSMPGKEEHFRQLLASRPKLDELPFDYSRRFASVLVGGQENLLIVKGSIDEVLGRCRYAQYRGERIPMGEDARGQVAMVVDDMLEDGMKVIAVACKTMDKYSLAPEDENDLTLLGYLAFFDAPKKSAVSAIEKLQQRNVGIRVLTGDQLGIALSICRRLNIPTEHCMTGSELAAIPENDLPVAVERTRIFAELSPRQKASVVEALQANGHCVGFLGDGLNDLPAIIGADVGISVDNAAEAVKESADVILLKKDLNVLEEGILEGRRAFANMTKYMKITASSNFGNILAVVFASVLLPFFPMTSVQLLLLNLLYDTLCLILPWDRVDEEMLRRPLEWTGKRLSRFMLFFGPLSSLFDIVTFLFLFFILCPNILGGSFASLTAASQAEFIRLFQTGWFLESMWTQVLILQLLRTEKIPFIGSRSSGSVLWVTVLGIAGFSLLTVTGLGAVLGLTAMPIRFYVYLVLIVISYLLLVSIGKHFFIRKYRELI